MATSGSFIWFDTAGTLVSHPDHPLLTLSRSRIRAFQWNSRYDSRAPPLPEKNRPQKDVASLPDRDVPNLRPDSKRRCTQEAVPLPLDALLGEELRVKKRSRLESEAKFEEKLRPVSRTPNFRRSTALKDGLRIQKRRRSKSEARFKETLRSGNRTAHFRRSTDKSTPSQGKTNRQRSHTASRKPVRGHCHSVPGPSSSKTSKGGGPPEYPDADRQRGRARPSNTLFTDRNFYIVTENSIS